MLIPDKFEQFCKVLNNNIGTIVECMLADQKAHPHVFPLLAQELRHRYTTNTQDDYAPATPAAVLHPEEAKKDISNQQPFYSMLHLIRRKNLMPALDDFRLNYIRTQNPQYADEEDYQILMDLLVWSMFDQPSYVRQKQQMDWRKQEEAKIRAAAEKYKRHQLVVQIGKEQMAKIVKDPKLSERFLLRPDVAAQQHSREQDRQFAREQVKKIAHNPLLLNRFIETSFRKIK